MTTANIPSEAQVIEWMDTLSNWGRWGADDQLGTLNLITDAKRAQAAGLVKEGISVTCSRLIVPEIAPTSPPSRRCTTSCGEETPPRLKAPEGPPTSLGCPSTGSPLPTSTACATRLGTA